MAVFGGEGNPQVNDLAVGAAGFVLVGTEFFDFSERGAVWFSSDGLTWERVSGSLFGGEYTRVWSVAAGSTGFVAAGSAMLNHSQAAAVWTSADGVTWSRTPVVDAASGGGEVSDLAAAGGAIVGVGYAVGKSTGDEQADLDAAVWGFGGRAWSRILSQEAFGGPGLQDMNSVTAFASGWVALGSEYISGDSQPVVWMSRSSG